jgi:hypothetical protein
MVLRIYVDVDQITKGRRLRLSLGKKTYFITHTTSSDVANTQTAVDRAGERNGREKSAMRLDGESARRPESAAEHAVLQKGGCHHGIDEGVVLSIVDVSVWVSVHPSCGYTEPPSEQIALRSFAII